MERIKATWRGLHPMVRAGVEATLMAGVVHELDALIVLQLGTAEPVALRWALDLAKSMAPTALLFAQYLRTLIPSPPAAE